MSESDDRHLGTAVLLRREFDASFARASSPAVAVQSFLGIRVGGDPYAIDLSELAGLHRDRRIVTAFGAESELLGIASVRGAMVPVYDLRRLLGYRSEGGEQRWLAVAQAPSPVGLAFERFETYLRVAPESTSTATAGDAARRHVRGVIRDNDALRPVIRVASVIEAIAGRRQQDHPKKEP